MTSPTPHLPENCAADMPWYLVHTKTRQEQSACENLARQGYTVYFPRIKVIKRVRGLKQALREPLFPRYVFLQPSSTAQSLAPVRSTLGVAAIVRFGQEPAQMRGDVLQNIRNFEAQRNAAKDADINPLQPGQSVRVADGPLAGLEGLISSVSKERVIVLMQLLGLDTEVQLSRHQLLLAH
jgi:transcriptional antiterminator RfaH